MTSPVHQVTSTPGRGASTPPVLRFEDPLEDLWSRMARPINLRGAVPAFTGIPRDLVADLCLFSVCLSHEAAQFLGDMPRMRRRLPHTTSMSKVRCDGHLRGPILWSETIVAQSHSLATDDVFVCGMSRRDFDVTENRLLAWHLHRIASAGRRLDGPAGALLDAGGRETVTERAAAARRMLGDKNLAEATRKRLTSGEVRKVRNGVHRKDLDLALELHARSTAPINPADISDLCDEITQAQLRALHLLIRALEHRGQAVPKITARNGSLKAGRLGFVHHRYEQFHGFAGVIFHDTLILAGRATAGGAGTAPRKVFFVDDFDDAMLAAEMVLGSRQAAGSTREAARAG